MGSSAGLSAQFDPNALQRASLLPLSQELMMTNQLRYEDEQQRRARRNANNNEFKYKMLGGLGPNIGTERWNEKMALY